MVFCNHCGKRIEAVYRGLLIWEWVAHPVGEDGKPNIDINVDGYPRVWEEHEDGACGVWYRCPHCGGDVTSLFDWSE